MVAKKPAGGVKAPSKALPKGPLLEPIRPDIPPPPPPSLLEQVADPESVARHKQAMKAYRASIKEEILQKKLAKMMLLAQHYGIEKKGPDLWFVLAWKLAQDYVPGLEVKISPDKKKGAPKKWSDMRLAKLYCSVMIKAKEIEERGNAKSVAAACAVLSKAGRWKGAGSAKTLNNKFDDSKKTAMVRMLSEISKGPRYGDEIYQIFFDQMTGNVGKMRQLDK